jgi:hypothetical protein
LSSDIPSVSWLPSVGKRPSDWPLLIVSLHAHMRLVKYSLDVPWRTSTITLRDREVVIKISQRGSDRIPLDVGQAIPLVACIGGINIVPGTIPPRNAN